MASTAAAAGMSMKLLIDRKKQRVLFAEASKEVVDFLFSLLALPVATAVHLVGEDAMVGCVANLYASVDRLDAGYVQPGAAKHALLSPTVVSPAADSSVLRLTSPGRPRALYRCAYDGSGACRPYVTDVYGRPCPGCGNQMSAEARHLSSAAGLGEAEAASGAAAARGFVRGVVTYSVMDDLAVAPMSAISSVALVDGFAVKNLGDLQEKTVRVGYDEGVAILKASLQSKTVLTDVFVAKRHRA